MDKIDRPSELEVIPNYITLNGEKSSTIFIKIWYWIFRQAL